MDGPKIVDMANGHKCLTMPSGGQRIAVARSNKSEMIIVSQMADVLEVRRHWDPDQASTAPCFCSPRCHSSRVDRMIAVLLRLGALHWEERVFICSEEGWASFQRNLATGEWNPSDIRGWGVLVQRWGAKANGRVTVTPNYRYPSVPPTFDLVAAVRNTVGIAADFFGAVGEVDDADDGPPARTRRDKPRVPLGTPTRKG
jgi:hypothetical protein